MKFTAIEVVDGDRFEGPWEGVGEWSACGFGDPDDFAIEEDGDEVLTLRRIKPVYSKVPR